MKTEIITIGDEILLGHILDSNAAFISLRLAEVGADVIRISTVGDGDVQIVTAIQEALNRAELVIITGGLGPTHDDITKAAICRTFDVEMEFHQDIYDLIDARYQRRGLVMPEVVRNQAEQPRGATLFPNPIGSAVGILMEQNGRRLIAMPGVPSEMMAIMTESVVPFLRQINPNFHVLYKKIQTFGTFESYISGMLNEAKFDHRDCELAYLPSLKGVILRLTYKGTDKNYGDKILNDYTAQLQTILGEYFVSDDGRDLVKTTTDLLIESGKTVSVAESCTAGMICAALTDVPGSSAYFIEGLVTYANRAKTDLLNVPQEILMQFGAVSEQTVGYMVDNMRKIAETDFALAVSGIAGPDGDTPEKPVGTIYIGITAEDGTDVHKHTFGTDRDINRQRTVYNAINYLRLKLLELN